MIQKAQVSCTRLNAYRRYFSFEQNPKTEIKGTFLTSFRPDAQKPALNNITPGENVMRS